MRLTCGVAAVVYGCAGSFMLYPPSWVSDCQQAALRLTFSQCSPDNGEFNSGANQ